MSFNIRDQGFEPTDSYSRKLDRRVAMDEYPYGYEGEVPPAGYQNDAMVHHYTNAKEKAQKEL